MQSNNEKKKKKKWYGREQNQYIYIQFKIAVFVFALVWNEYFILYLQSAMWCSHIHLNQTNQTLSVYQI